MMIMGPFSHGITHLGTQMKVVFLETARRQLEGTLVLEIAGKSFFPLQVKYHSVNTIVCWEKPLLSRDLTFH